MSGFYIKIGRDRLEIDKAVFLILLDLSPIKNYVAYEEAVAQNEISFTDLKDLAEKADVPYPLFFASKAIVDKHIKDNEKNLFDKLPTKSEAQVGVRGNLKRGEMDLIVKDLARKQEFLKNRILTQEQDNDYIGEIAKQIKQGASRKNVAEYIRSYFKIDLQELRDLSKKKVIDYLCTKIEDKNILVSISSYNFMPQNIARDVGASAICVKDKKFPYIFINTREGDEHPLFLESDGRQIFSIISMLVAVGMNKFILNMKSGNIKNRSLKQVYSITAEILIPEDDLKEIIVGNIDDIKQGANLFKVTPSMLLVRLRELGLIAEPLADAISKKLFEELEQATPVRKNQPTLVNGHGKYNGGKFSRESVRAYYAGKVSASDIKNSLFRKNRMNAFLFDQYCNTYK